MKLDTFFEKFTLFAEAPGAAGRLRELILQLAMRGRLLPQIDSEGNATDLLARIETARSKAFARKKVREDSAAPISWHLIPLSWRWATLGDIGQIVGGGTPRSTNPEYFDDIGIPWLTPADLNGYTEKYIINGRRFITQLGLENSSAQLLPEGSVLFSSRAPIGYVAIAGTALATNQGFKSCVPFVPEMNGFIYYYLKSAASRIDSEATGTTFREVSGKAVAQIPIPVPPLAEQKRIVAKVDELMALCDRLEAQQQERETQHAALSRAALTRFAEDPTPANLEWLFHASFSTSVRGLRQLILTLAVQGELVPFNAKANGASVGDHVRFQNGHAFKSEWFKPSGTRVCRNTNISHGLLDWRESAFVDQQITTEFERFLLREDDIVLSLDRPLISGGLKVARVRESDLPCLLLQRVARVMPKHDQIDLSYFMLWLNSSAFVSVIDPGRSNGVPHISTRQVEQIPFALPPLPEQRRIVAKVDELMALVDQLEARRTAARAAATRLLDAAVAELTT